MEATATPPDARASVPGPATAQMAPLTRAQRVGRALSVALHPFVLVPLSIVLASRALPLGSRAAVLGTTACVAAVIAAFVAHELRRGAVTDLDVSVARDRPRLFSVSIGALVASAAVLSLAGGPPAAVLGMGAAAVMLIVASVINRWIKVSLHVSFAVYAAAVCWQAGAFTFGAMALAAVAVGWARVAYNRHTRLEVACGYALGTLAGVLVQLLVRR